jgi:hypothetical protein
VASSDSVTVGPDGVARRSWQDHGDQFIAPGDLSARWWRVTCEGTVRFEGPQDLGVLPRANGTLAERATAAWRATTRHAGGGEPTVAWIGSPTGGQPTAVFVGRVGCGGGLVTALTDVPQAEADSVAWYYPGRAPTRGGDTVKPAVVFASVTTATATSPDLVAVRLPAPAMSQLGDQILVVAPPGTTGLRVGGGPETVPVAARVAVITRPAPTGALTLQAVDGTGQVLAETLFSEPDANGQLFGEPYVDQW